MNNIAFSGEAGTVLWGYRPAATVKAWTLSRSEAGALVLSASVVSSDLHRLSQRPLLFLIHRPDRIWRWPILELQVSGAALSASLGPEESAHALADRPT